MLYRYLSKFNVKPFDILLEAHEAQFTFTRNIHIIITILVNNFTEHNPIIKGIDAFRYSNIQYIIIQPY